MYLRQIKRPQGIYLAIQESYYDSSKKQSRTRTIESIGYLDNLRKEYEDPIAFFSQKAAAMTSEKKKEKSKTIVIDGSEKMDTNTDDILNVGYGILKHLYKELELDKFWNWKSRNLSVEFSVDQIFRLLVFSRILCPASKKGTFDNQNFYFEDFGDFSLDDIYHALDIICKNNEALQKWIFDHSEKLYDLRKGRGSDASRNVCLRDLRQAGGKAVRCARLVRDKAVLLHRGRRGVPVRVGDKEFS